MPLLLLWKSVLFLVLLIVLGCGQGPEDDVAEEPDTVTADVGMDKPWFGRDKGLQGEVVINDAGLPVAHWGRDRYVIETRGGDAPVIEDDTLAITVSYSGGCEDHEFTLVASAEFAESYPVQLQVSLAHNGNGDLCRAYPTETYGFDLTPIKMLYQEAYQEDAGTVVLLFRETPEDVPDLMYTFES